MKFNLNQNQFNTLAAALIIIGAIIVYSNTIQVPFQFDDIYHITQKNTIRDLGNFTKIGAWKNINSRPLPMFTLALNYRWAGVNPAGYHVLNLIFHILAGWVVYLLTMQILGLKHLKLGKHITENKQYFALLAALLFIAHPIQTQAVTYVIQRITVLAALFYLLGVYYYIKGRLLHLESGDIKEAVKFYVMTFVFFVLALMSKQISVTFPLALLLVEFFFIRDKNGLVQKKYLTVAGIAVAAVILIGMITYGIPRESKDIPRHTYLITSFKVFVKYIQLYIFPVNQNLDYDFKASESLFGWKELGSLAIIGGLLYLAFRMIKKNPLVAFGILWFFITLLVEQTVIPIKDFIFEHRMYLPSFGLIIGSLAAIFTYVPGLLSKKAAIKPVMVMVLLLIIIYGATARERNKVWETDLTLWTDVVKKSPEKARAHLWQGIAFTNIKDYDNAKASMDRCIEILPNFPMAYYNRGNIFKDLEDNVNALKDYDKAIELDPKYMLAYFNRGVVKAKLGRYASAIEDYNIALKSDPDNTNTLYNRANSLRRLRKYQESIKDYDRAIEIDPQYTLAIFNRGLSKAGMNQHEAAIQDFDLAIRQDQKNHLFYNGKGVSLYQMGRFQEAIANYDAAIRVNPNFGQAYYNRGFAKFLGLGDNAGGCADWEMAAKMKYRDANAVMNRYCGTAKPTK